jgi:hypothetical protein
VGTVFGSIDLVQEILLNLTDDPTNLSMITGVSKSFQAAALESSQVWRDACRLRWSKKWGFAEQWKRAERESQSSGRGWRNGLKTRLNKRTRAVSFRMGHAVLVDGFLGIPRECFATWITADCQ